MNHLVYLDHSEKEYENLALGSKTMLIRGATGRKLPHGRVNPQDVIYFIVNDGGGDVVAKAVVKTTFHSDKLDPAQSIKIVENNLSKLQIKSQGKFYKRFAGKRFLVLIEVENFKSITPFKFARERYGNMDDWIPFEQLAQIQA